MELVVCSLGTRKIKIDFGVCLTMAVVVVL